LGSGAVGSAYLCLGKTIKYSGDAGFELIFLIRVYGLFFLEKQLSIVETLYH
jgi:hypothetical protein